MKKTAIALSLAAGLVVTSSAFANDTPTQGEMDTYLSGFHNDQTCTILGRAAMNLGSKAYAMKRNPTQQISADALKEGAAKALEKAPLNADKDMQALVGATRYIIDDGDALIPVILEAAGTAGERKEAQLNAHRAIASPCSALYYIETPSGPLKQEDIKAGILEEYQAHRSNKQ